MKKNYLKAIFVLTIFVLINSISFTYKQEPTKAEFWSFAAKPYEGAGTTSSPFLISTPENLAYMAKRVNSGNDKSSVFSLISDIDLSKNGRCWIPIGIPNNEFNGVFNGNKHKIKNMKITTSLDMSVYTSAGLFGLITSSARVADIEFLAPSIQVISKSGGLDANRVGIVAGWVKNMNNPIEYNLENIVVRDINISLTYGNQPFHTVGGIVGQSNGGIKNCQVLGGSITGHAMYMGGVVGVYNGNVAMYYCCNYATVINSRTETNENYTGGVAGCAGGSICVSYNVGKVRSKGLSAGIVVGASYLWANYSIGVVEGSLGTYLISESSNSENNCGVRLDKNGNWIDGISMVYLNSNYFTETCSIQDIKNMYGFRAVSGLDKVNGKLLKNSNDWLGKGYPCFFNIFW